jgi:hypothetical protein
MLLFRFLLSMPFFRSVLSLLTSLVIFLRGSGGFVFTTKEAFIISINPSATLSSDELLSLSSISILSEESVLFRNNRLDGMMRGEHGLVSDGGLSGLNDSVKYGVVSDSVKTHFLAIFCF